MRWGEICIIGKYLLRVHVLVFYATLFFLAVGTVHAQAPEHTQGWTKYGFGLTFIPQGEERQLSDQAGQTYRLIQSAQLVDLSLQGSYRFNRRATLHLELGTNHHLRQTWVKQTTGSLTKVRLESAHQSSWWSSGRLVVQQEKTGRIRLQWSLTVRYPWVVKVHAGFSLIGDPVVLTGALHYEMLPVEGLQSVSVQCGVGLVANESVSLILSAQHSLPLQAVRPPGSMVSLGVTYYGGKLNERELSVQNVLEAVGGQVYTGMRTQVYVKNMDLP
jgi:hypothetical protein